ncbi:hypothetical protein HYZ78_00365 [Candidatus Microgenomates bacterium]|nr:hypothetical protein [Candidatus Microgenomates bacterium]
MLGKTITFLVAFSIILVITPKDAFAKRLLPQAKQGTTVSKSTTGAVSSKGGVKISVKFKSGKSGIVATFSDLEKASSVAYSLTYSQRGIKEGAGGTLSDLTGTQVRELFFATCSHGVCRYHTGIKNARFVVTTTLPNGKKIGKAFRLKI